MVYVLDDPWHGNVFGGAFRACFALLCFALLCFALWRPVRLRPCPEDVAMRSSVILSLKASAPLLSVTLVMLSHLHPFTCAGVLHLLHRQHQATAEVRVPRLLEEFQDLQRDSDTGALLHQPCMQLADAALAQSTTGMQIISVHACCCGGTDFVCKAVQLRLNLHAHRSQTTSRSWASSAA